MPVKKKVKIWGTKRSKIAITDECSNKTCLSHNTAATKMLEKKDYNDETNDCKIIGVHSAIGCHMWEMATLEILPK